MPPNPEIQAPARRTTRPVKLRHIIVGGNAPVSVQTMTKTDTRDVPATLDQILQTAAAGCDIVRVAVPDATAAAALARIVSASPIPVVADIHFDHKLALIAIDAGVDGLRINPGNIGPLERVREIVHAARPRAIPIRIGVNGGSLEPDIEKSFGGPTAEALVASAMRHVRILEQLDYHEIKISVKATNVRLTVDAYRLLAQTTHYPLHVGLTEAGTLLAGTIRSSVAMGILLAEGIGDTIRVSLTDSPLREVDVGIELLRSLALRPPGPNVISCPTCGRVQVDVAAAAAAIEAGLRNYYATHPDAPRPLVAVMGCMVNGPGEARHADIALAGGQGKFALYVKGTYTATLPEAEAVAAVLAQVAATPP